MNAHDEFPETPAAAEPLRSPAPEPVTRTNRHVLVAGALVLVVLVISIGQMIGARPERPAAEPRAGASAPGTGGIQKRTDPTFLTTERAAPAVQQVPLPAAYPELGSTPADAGIYTQAGNPPPEVIYGSGGSGNPFGGGGYGAAPQPSPREQARQAALARGMRFGGGRGSQGVGRTTAGSTGAVDGVLQTLQSSLASLQTNGGPPAAQMLAPGTPGADARGEDRYAAFRRSVAETRRPTYLAAEVERPLTPYQLMEGTLIPATLVTGINSDGPCDVLAQVPIDVYDTQQRYLLIPQGTRLVGACDNQVASGDQRLVVAWTRMVFPDGSSLRLPGLDMKDLAGAGGVRASVNNHTGTVFRNALLLSIVGAGAQLSQPRTGGSVFSTPSAGQVGAGAVGQELARVSQSMLQRGMNRRPTLTLPPGTPIQVYLNQDLVLERPYLAAR